MQEGERKEQVTIAEDVVNFKEGVFHAELQRISTVTRKANVKQPDELPNSDELQTML